MWTSCFWVVPFGAAACRGLKYSLAPGKGGKEFFAGFVWLYILFFGGWLLLTAAFKFDWCLGFLKGNQSCIFKYYSLWKTGRNWWLYAGLFFPRLPVWLGEILRVALIVPAQEKCQTAFCSATERWVMQNEATLWCRVLQNQGWSSYRVWML